MSGSSAGRARGASRAELRKLLAQPAIRALGLVCAFGPLAFAAILSGQGGVPGDTLLGAWVHSSGYAFSLVVLGFGGYLGFPVLAAVLAGDLLSSEDRYGTWKTIATRSLGRGELFAGKLTAAAGLAVVLLCLAALSSTVAGLIFMGGKPLVGLGGNVLSGGGSVLMVLAAWLLCIPALLGFVSLAVLLSAASRNGIVGVLGPILAGLGMQLLALVGSGSWMHAALLSGAFDGWHGLLGSPRFYAPLGISVGVAVAWSAASLAGAWWILRRRDFAGTPVAARPGWGLPARVLLLGAAALVALGLAGGLGPAAVTAARLEASIQPLFGRLIVLQQRELGRAVPIGLQPRLRTRCRRHGARATGPGDDWTCTLTIVSPTPGSEPFQLTPVTYELSVKANGCYRAEAPPSFVGQQTMTDAAGHSVVNPLFVFYGCFDTTAAPPRHGPGAGAARGGSGGSAARARATREAEQAAGTGVLRETEASERAIERQSESGRAPEESSRLNLGR